MLCAPVLMCYRRVMTNTTTTDLPECEGHESTDGPIGNVVYCDGSCHRRRVTRYDLDLFRWTCTCGASDDDYLTRDYAIDGWREAHDLDPVTNYPQV